MTDIWWGTMQYSFFSQTAFPDTYSSPEPEQFSRYHHRPGRLSNYLSQPSLVKSLTTCAAVILTESQPRWHSMPLFIGVTDCGGRCQTFLHVQEINVKACALVILNQIMWMDRDSNPGPSPIPCTRQHPNYGDCLEFKREYYQNSSMLDYVTQCSQSAAHLCEQFL